MADSLAISNGGKTYTSQGGKLSVEKLIISNGSYDSSSEFAVIRDGALQTKSTIVGDTGNANGLHVFSSYSTDSLLLGNAVNSYGEASASNSTGGTSNINVTGLTTVGYQGHGYLSAVSGGVIHSGSMIVGNESNKVGNKENHLGATIDSKVVIDNDLILGNKANSFGDVGFTSGSSLSVGRDMVIGKQGTGEAGFISKTNLSIGRDLIVGEEGKGDLFVSADSNAQVNGVTYIGGAGLNPNAEGSIRINSSNFNAPIISFGGFGKGELSLFQDAVLKTTEINRNAQARPSTINLNGGTIQLTASQPELFGNFTSTDVISINNLGGTIETLANNVNIFDKAVIGGSGNFIKKGTGLLAMNTASKAWTGETHIDQGTLKLNGDYAMRDGEVLAVGLNTADDYGKLLVDGNADISKGKLQINASQAVQAMPNSSTWLNVVKATARNGQFATLSDNSPLVDFYAD